MTRPRVLAGPVTHHDGEEVREVWWVECPGCERAATVDRDQIEGRVSMDCKRCEYHETHDLTEAAEAEPRGDFPF